MLLNRLAETQGRQSSYDLEVVGVYSDTEVMARVEGIRGPDCHCDVD